MTIALLFCDWSTGIGGDELRLCWILKDMMTMNWDFGKMTLLRYVVLLLLLLVEPPQFFVVIGYKVAGTKFPM